MEADSTLFTPSVVEYLPHLESLTSLGIGSTAYNSEWTVPTRDTVLVDHLLRFGTHSTIRHNYTYTLRAKCAVSSRGSTQFSTNFILAPMATTRLRAPTSPRPHSDLRRFLHSHQRNIHTCLLQSSIAQSRYHLHQRFPNMLSSRDTHRLSYTRRDNSGRFLANADCFNSPTFITNNTSAPTHCHTHLAPRELYEYHLYFPP